MLNTLSPRARLTPRTLSGKQLALTRGRLALRCSIRYQCRSHHQPLSHGLTTPVGRLLRRYALTLIVFSHTLALSSRMKNDRVCVCACTHYLVFKEPTDQSSLGRLEVLPSGTLPRPSITCLAGRV